MTIVEFMLSTTHKKRRKEMDKKKTKLKIRTSKIKKFKTIKRLRLRELLMTKKIMKSHFISRKISS